MHRRNWFRSLLAGLAGLFSTKTAGGSECRSDDAELLASFKAGGERAKSARDRMAAGILTAPYLNRRVADLDGVPLYEDDFKPSAGVRDAYTQRCYQELSVYRRIRSSDIPESGLLSSGVNHWYGGPTGSYGWELISWEDMRPGDVVIFVSTHGHSPIPCSLEMTRVTGMPGVDARSGQPNVAVGDRIDLVDNAIYHLTPELDPFYAERKARGAFAKEVDREASAAWLKARLRREDVDRVTHPVTGEVRHVWRIPASVRDEVAGSSASALREEVPPEVLRCLVAGKNLMFERGFLV